jgi:uncharacterized protein (TIGR02145 family)
MKKSIFGNFVSLYAGCVLIFAVSCEMDEPATLPELSTMPLTNITSKSFTSGGIITSDGRAIVSARGVCWGTDFNPTIDDNITTDGAGTGSFVSFITGLEDGTIYYVRAYAVNSLGIAYGNQIYFITPLTDIEGNVYNTVIIGTQVWMTQNLKTTKYYDNTAIPNVADNIIWSTLSTPAYCWYKNDASSNKNIYGALYNWFTINTGKLCPAGWHVPSEEEWTTLFDNLGGESIASGKLKEQGTGHWVTPNMGASNIYGFSALPGGYRTGRSPGSFRTARYYGWWWANTEYDLSWARGNLMTYDAIEIAKGSGLKTNGYSIRCIKD